MSFSIADFQSLDDLDKNASIQVLMNTLQSLSSLRSVLMKGLESGLRNDATDAGIAMRQKVISSNTTQNFFSYWLRTFSIIIT